jgi:MFS transporter, PHS family, inorganic phosphate transporter
VGVGGEYPLAATVTSESTSAAKRGQLMSAVFSMQGVGALLSVVIVLVSLSTGFSSAYVWRFALAFGAVPAILAFPWRLRMHETESFEKVKQARLQSSAILSRANSHGSMDASSHGQNNNGGGGSVGLVLFGDELSTPTGKSSTTGTTASKISTPSTPSASSVASSIAAATPSRLSEISRAFKYYKYHMLGTALSWFLLDVDFYANGLFNHDITSLILSKGKPTRAIDDARNSLILCLISIPGYWLSVLYMERIGRKRIQMMGFTMMGLLFFICGWGHDWLLADINPSSPSPSSANPSPMVAQLKQWGFLLLYSLTFLFSNFGPNTTTFIIPGEHHRSPITVPCPLISGGPL